MFSWYFRRYRPVTRSRVSILSSESIRLEDRVTPVADFTAGAAFASNLTNPNALEFPIRAGDFNADGKQDFISFAGFGSSELVTFFGNGDGTFTFKAKLDLAGFATPRTESVTVGDFNSDGKDDFAYIDSAFNFVDIWASKGDGTFANINSIPTDARRISMAAGDLNNDGKTDLILGRLGGGGPGNTPGEYEVMLGDGTGNFTASERTATANLDFITGQPTIADMNGDNIPDFVAHNAFAISGLGRAGVYYGKGDGSFSAASALKTSQNSGVNDHVVGDFNGDGMKDVALVTGTLIEVFLQTSPGVFAGTPTSSFTLDTAPNELVAADYDFDGRTDIVTAPFSAIDNNIRVYSPDATGIFTPGGGLAFASAGENINLAVIDGDFNGTPDLIASQRLTGPSFKFQYFDNNNIPTAPISSTVTITAVPNPVTFGSPVTFTAKVAQFGTIPTGTVDFIINGSVFATLPLDATGRAVLNSSGPPFAVGTLTYSAHYNGDATFLPRDSLTGSIVVDPLPAAVNATFTSFVAPVPPNPGQSVYGANVGITATVTPVGTFTPTGSFDFFAGSFYLGTVPVDATGTAVLNTTQIPATNSTTITTVYSGDAIYSTGTFTTADTLQVFQLPTVTEVITSSNPSVYGEPVTYTVQVSADPAVSAFIPVNPVFVGQVAIFDNDNVIATPSVDATGAVVFTVPADYALGSHTIRVVFPGDANLAFSESTPFNQIVNKANSQIVVTPSSSTITFGEDVLLTATVGILAPGVGTTDGQVTFFQDGLSIGTFDLDASGMASMVVSGLEAATYNFTATFSGNDNVNGSASAVASVTVDPTTSTTVLEILPNPAPLGDTIVATAFISTSNGLPVNVGSVLFSGTYNGQPIGPFGSPVFNGIATLSFPGGSLEFGSGELTAQYFGNASILDSADGPVAFSVEKAVPGVALSTSTPTSAALGSTSKFTVSLSAPAGVSFPITGTVQFFDNGTLFDTQTVSGGLASTTRVLTLGDHTITAAYSGDANFNSGTAQPILVNIFRPTDRFSVGAGIGGPDRVNVYDAAGNVVFTPLFAFSPDYTSGVRVATADFDGDGVQDVAMGTGPGTGSRVRILSGVDGTPIADFSPFGESFTGGVYLNAGDVNGDFKADLVVTPDQKGGARIRLFDNAALVDAKSIAFPLSITSRADFIGIIDGNGQADTDFRGGARAAIGDVDGDGFGDIVMSAGFGGGPRIATFSGKTLTVTGGPKLFGDFLGFESKLRNGSFVAVGDIDGDGKADIATGAGPNGGPRVAIFSAASLIAGSPTKIADFFAGNTESRSGVPIAFRYLNNDERLDLIAGSGSGDDHVTAYSGTTLVGAFSAPTPILSFDAFSSTPNPEDAFRGTFVG